MPDAAAPIPLRSLGLAGWPSDVRDLVDAVVDVARRLNQNVLAAEHLLVVGAENGLEEMARTVGSLAAFREALLDGLYDDREHFKRTGPGAEKELFVTPGLKATLLRLKAGEDPPRVLAELMQGDEPRLRRALAYARDVEPDVVPPDTLALDAEATVDPGRSAAPPSGEASAASASASASSPSRAAERSRTPGRRASGALPLTSDIIG